MPRGSGAALPDEPRHDGGIRKSRPVVLVVDDEAAMRKYVTANLAARGYGVLSAADGVGALEALRTCAVDLLVLDLILPGADGLLVLRTARDHAGVGVIAISADVQALQRLCEPEWHVDAYLVKPFGVDELLAALQMAHVAAQDRAAAAVGSRQ